MKVNRRSIAAGLVVGVLAGGAGGALAATTAPSSRAGTASTTNRSLTGGWGRYGGGFGTATAWPYPGTGSGWGSRPGWGAGANTGALDWLSAARSGRRAALTYLGLSASQLRSRLRSRQPLAQIAAGQGKSVTGLKRAVETSIAGTVDADSALSAAQRSSIIARLDNVVDSIVTGTWYGAPAGPPMSGGW
jgi:hypothetical protein